MIIIKTILFLEPVLKEMIWGGNKLRREFGYKTEKENIGECWGIAAHKNGDSRVICSEFEGYKLSELWREHKELFGNMEGEVFPLLVKIIDAKEDLSIQVHPDDTYANKNEDGSLGKTECWYVLDCEKDTTIIIGHNAKNKQELERMIDENRWNELLREIPVSEGSFFQIEPGCVHAIKGGTMILETQQNSDITYRLYDYDRLSADGSPRDLHTRKAIDVITTPHTESCYETDKQIFDEHFRETLVQCPYYTVEKITIKRKAKVKQVYNFMNVSVIEGCGVIDGREIKKGNHFILPYGYGEAELVGEMELIISYI